MPCYLISSCYVYDIAAQVQTHTTQWIGAGCLRAAALRHQKQKFGGAEDSRRDRTLLSHALGVIRFAVDLQVCCMFVVIFLGL